MAMCLDYGMVHAVLLTGGVVFGVKSRSTDRCQGEKQETGEGRGARYQVSVVRGEKVDGMH